jgi:hypothetical protein
LRLATALHALPTWQDIQATPVQAGPWVANAPLWGNPFAAQQQGQPLACKGLEASFPALAAVPSLRTVWDLREAILAVHRVTSAVQYQAQVWGLVLAGRAELQDWVVAKQQLLALANSLPVEWRPVVVGNGINAEQLLAVPEEAAVATQLVKRLGWAMPRGRPMSLAKATVRGFTQLQLFAQRQLVGERMHRFKEAVSPAGALAVTQHEVLALLRKVWCLRWDNQRKELLWRLVLNGLPTAARMDMLGEACQCGVMAPGCRHHFWECPPAHAVRAVMELAVGCPISCEHVWLARPPRAGLHGGVWRVVSLAALLGMDKARRALCRWRLEDRQQQQQHARVHRHTQPPPPLHEQLGVAARVAVATFWDMLTDFVGVQGEPVAWRQAIPVDHPFIAPSAGRDRLMVRREHVS